VLKTRMLGGDPPDSFQVHAGQELIGTWVVADRMEDLTFLYEEMGWFDKYPQGLIDASSTADGIWSVPVNIHRSNVMWYVPAKLEEWGITPPASWDEFLEMCPTIQAAGVTPLALGENWTHNHLWESVALGVLGPDDYDKLWTAELPFNDPKAMAVWDVFGEVLACTNDDAAGLSWQQATDMVVAGTAAFNIMGDWAMGYLTTTLGLEPGVGYGWAPSPGTDGVFMWLSDAFGLPKGIRTAKPRWTGCASSAPPRRTTSSTRSRARSPRTSTPTSRSTTPTCRARPPTGRATASSAAWRTAPWPRRPSPATSPPSWRSTSRPAAP
jgi:glucose/mannose transport system substrate-binding protein